MAEYDPFARTPRDRITAIAVAAPVAIVPPLLASESFTEPACETQNYSRSGSACPSPVFRPASEAGAAGAASVTELAGAARTTESGGTVCMAGPGGAENHCTNAVTDTPEARFRVQFSAGPAFMERLARVRAIASHRLPANASLEQVFALALEYFIEREDPAKRHERRERRAAAGNGLVRHRAHS